MSGARLKHYGWGREDEGMTAEEQAFVLGRYNAKFARDAFETKDVPHLEDLALREPRTRTPMANPIRTTCEPCSATTIARPTWSHIHATKQRFPL